ncbi:hypothetical protein AHiyo6_01200 [Arthrobacter sp. Hiyo6]|nr:hypothetical protein AHiyo6_01200 [Arthrobacter sp. Hiyo6]
MALRVNLSTMTSNSGDKVELQPWGVTCIVGGNNAGKSQALRDIDAFLRNPDASGVVMRGITLDKSSISGTGEVEEYLASNALRVPPQPGSPQLYTSLMSGGASADATSVARALSTEPDSLVEAWHFFYRHLTAGSLAIWSSQGAGHVSMRGDMNSPLHQLFRDGDLEEELSKLAYKVFEENLTLDRVNMDVRLR